MIDAGAVVVADSTVVAVGGGAIAAAILGGDYLPAIAAVLTTMGMTMLSGQYDCCCCDCYL